MQIIVYGPGCTRCNQTAQIIMDTLNAANIEFDLKKVSDFAAIAQAGVMATPGVAVNGKIVSTGKVPTAQDVKSWLK